MHMSRGDPVLKLILSAFALASAAPTEVTPRQMEELFFAPCCWRENLAYHQSPQAEAMRTEIRQMLEEGKTRRQIIDLYVARYGEKILREPRGAVWIWLTAIPMVAVVSGGLLLALYVARLRRRSVEHTGADAPPAPDVDDWE